MERVSAHGPCIKKRKSLGKNPKKKTPKKEDEDDSKKKWKRENLGR